MFTLAYTIKRPRFEHKKCKSSYAQKYSYYHLIGYLENSRTISFAVQFSMWRSTVFCVSFSNAFYMLAFPLLLPKNPPTVSILLTNYIQIFFPFGDHTVFFKLPIPRKLGFLGRRKIYAQYRSFKKSCNIVIFVLN